MSGLGIGLLGCLSVFVLLAIRVPIGIVLGGVSMVGIALLRGPKAAFSITGSEAYEFVAHWSLSAIPMFILMGAITYRAGLAGKIFFAARIWVGHVPGGLAAATNVAAAMFSSVCGSSLATSAAIGRIAIPEMLRSRYDPGLATAVVAAAGTVGSLIPPSIIIIIYGYFAQQNIGKLLIAVIIPGLLTALAYIVMIVIRCRANPALGPAVAVDFSGSERRKAMFDLWPMVLLVVGVVGGIYSGLVTSIEAGAFGAFLALVISVAQRTIGARGIAAAVVETCETTASILFIAVGAVLFTKFMALCGVPAFISATIEGMNISDLQLILLTMLVYIVLGAFLDPIGALLLTLPVFIPIFEARSIDMLWVGILIIKFIEIGLLTPPVGFNAFVVKSVAGDSVPIGTIFRGLGWFLVVEMVVVALLIAFPQLTLFLPTLMG